MARASRPFYGPRRGPEAAAASAPTERTAGQRDWLESLMPEQRVVFEAKSPRTQADLLEPHRSGRNPDPTIARDQAEKLAPPRPPVDGAAIRTVEDAVGAPVGGSRPAAPRLAEMLAREFRDRTS